MPRGTDVVRRVSATISLTAALAALVAAPALASGRTQTLKGEGSNGSSPDSETAIMHVDAEEKGGVTSGTLTTAGKDGEETYAQFEGHVTCIKAKGPLILVSAVGTASIRPNFGPPKPLPGTYAQTLSVELGSFTDPNLEESPTYTFRYGFLGEHGEGVKTTKTPKCNKGPAPTELPTSGGSVHYERSRH